MNVRSTFLLGDHIFIKLINIPDWNLLVNALKTGDYIPFEMNELAITQLMKKDLTPGTKVLLSKNTYTLEDFSKYRGETYRNSEIDLKKSFSEFNVNLTNIKTGIIISQRVQGSFEAFLNQSQEDVKDALFHISYLYYRFQKKYKMIHVDSKINNYTWEKLETPVEITYDFGTYKTVKKVKNLFYLTDLEFVYSPVIKKKDGLFYNFSYKYEWLKDENKEIIVPKISIDPYYDYNTNLFLGIEQKIPFLRMYAIDILTMIKMILSHSYISNLSPDVSRILQKYFTNFVALSKKEKEFPYNVDYSLVSPESFSKMLL